jgi:hypothetical protein
MANERKYPKRATKEDKAKFQEACRMLDELGQKGFGLYLANDTMNLMTGATHDERGRPQQENSAECAHISGAGGGDW